MDIIIMTLIATDNQIKLFVLVLFFIRNKVLKVLIFYIYVFDFEVPIISLTVSHCHVQKPKISGR